MSETKHRLSKIKSRYDVAIVGGGIYGAATAWEAASRGLSVILIETDDFCSGTSANSLKTIHGGLRSLQRFDFFEMREYIRERRALLRIAPHLISPMQCVIPTYSKFSKSKIFLGLGMKVYDLIAFDRNKGLKGAQRINKTQIISAEEVKKLAPDLEVAGITGGASWFDAQVYNSERLVFSYIMSAKQAGADIYNYVVKDSYVIEHGKVTGLNVTDKLAGTVKRINADAVIDCCGPWATTNQIFVETIPKSMQPKLMARAVNIVLNHKLSDSAFGVNTRATVDGNNRLMFIAPWRKGSIVGTWYYPKVTIDDKAILSEDELSQCLLQINNAFPSLNLSKANVSHIHHGLQPADANKEEGNEPKLWRHTKIIDSKIEGASTGLFWVQGVKLTTARATAENVINKVIAYLCKDVNPSATSVTALYGGDVTDRIQLEKELVSEFSELISTQTVVRLVRNYGSTVRDITKLCRDNPLLTQLVPGVEDTIKAELEFIIKHEMVYTLSDLLLRRTDIGSFECPDTKTIEYCADVMTDLLHWDSDQRAESIDQLLKKYHV